MDIGKSAPLALLAVMLCLLATVSAGCNERESRVADENTTTEPQTARTGESENNKTARIVFVGQKQACECTRNRIESSWQALQAAKKSSPAIPVERIDRDVQQETAARYAKLKALMVVPGIYFLDEKGSLVGMLQGEVEQDAIGELLP